jgi:putative transposase
MENHQRHSMRLQGYDYAEEGVYFITVVTHHREALFGSVVDGEMGLNEFEKIVELTWHDLKRHNANIDLDEFVVMPNHVHGIIQLFEPSNILAGEGLEPSPISERAGNRSTPTGKRLLLCEIVRQFKTFSAKRINQRRGTPGVPVWQRSFYDHIICGERDYENIASYILMNPQNWRKDDEYSTD